MTESEKHQYHRPDLMPVVTLREYMEARLMALALAVEKQEAAYNLRFANVNEWRDTFEGVANSGVTKELFDNRLRELERRIGNIEQRQANIDGRIIGWSAGAAAVVLVITIVMQLLNIGG